MMNRTCFVCKKSVKKREKTYYAGRLVHRECLVSANIRKKMANTWVW